MNIDWTLLFHASYVAFAFSILLFGALAYRQILDALALRGMHLGEDRDSFVSAPGILLMGILAVLSGIVAWVSFGYMQPAIYSYALPMILMIQIVQFTMRLVFQRTLVRTRGIIVKSTFMETRRAVAFDEISDVEMRREMLWVTIVLTIRGKEQVTFRIFRFSAIPILRILRGWCRCPVRITSSHIS